MESVEGWWDRHCFGRPIERKDAITGRVAPPQSESSIAPESHEREGKKEKNTKTQKEEIHVSVEIKNSDNTDTPA